MKGGRQDRKNDRTEKCESVSRDEKRGVGREAKAKGERSMSA